VNIGAAVHSCQVQNRAPESPPVRILSQFSTLRAHLAVRSKTRRSDAERRTGATRPVCACGRARGGSRHGVNIRGAAWPRYAVCQLAQALHRGAERRACRPRWCQSWRGAATTAGRSAITTGGRRQKRDCNPSTAVTARRWDAANQHRVRLWRSRDIGRRTDGRSTPAASSRSSIAAVLFIAFHGSWNRAPLPQQGYR